MSLTLHAHPLSSFCMKAIVPLYENDTPFKLHLVNLGDPESAGAFKTLWPIGKFPVLVDEARAGHMVPESSVIIEYLDQHYPGKTRFIPADPELARRVRFADRFYDLHVHMHMQKIIGDRLRPADKKDPYGVEDAKKRMNVALDMIEKQMASQTWAMGDSFTMADCSAAPALFYAEIANPFRDTHKTVAAYLDRLKARPSFARTLKEAEPYFNFIPK